MLNLNELKEALAEHSNCQVFCNDTAANDFEVVSVEYDENDDAVIINIERV